MTSPAELDTPAVTVDLDVMAANIRRVQQHLERHGIANRPHIKTHKIPEIGRLQMAGGAVGIRPPGGSRPAGPSDREAGGISDHA